MRFEIDDSKAIIKKSEFEVPQDYSTESIKLGDLMDHKELFRQYPEFKNIDVRIDSSLKRGAFFSQE